MSRLAPCVVAPVISIWMCVNGWMRYNVKALWVVIMTRKVLYKYSPFTIFRWPISLNQFCVHFVSYWITHTTPEPRFIHTMVREGLPVQAQLKTASDPRSTCRDWGSAAILGPTEKQTDARNVIICMYFLDDAFWLYSRVWARHWPPLSDKLVSWLVLVFFCLFPPL